MFPTAHKECCVRRNPLLAVVHVALVTNPKRNPLLAVALVAQVTNPRNPLLAVLPVELETSNGVLCFSVAHNR